MDKRTFNLVELSRLGDKKTETELDDEGAVNTTESCFGDASVSCHFQQSRLGNLGRLGNSVSFYITLTSICMAWRREETSVLSEGPVHSLVLNRLRGTSTEDE